MAISNIIYMLGVLIPAFAAGFLMQKVGVGKIASIAVGLIIVVIGYIAYISYFENVITKNYGGVMSYSIQDGRYHVGSTWKGDNLWVETYDPKTGVCHFSEKSRIGALEGEVRIKNCSPIGLNLNK